MSIILISFVLVMKGDVIMLLRNFRNFSGLILGNYFLLLSDLEPDSAFCRNCSAITVDYGGEFLDSFLARNQFQFLQNFKKLLFPELEISIKL